MKTIKFLSSNILLKSSRFLLLSSLVAGGSVVASAQSFFSTEQTEQLFTIGVRAGVNTSNRTVSASSLPGLYHHESWGTGFDLGATVGINIRDYISIQPGFFFEALYGRNVAMGSLFDEGKEYGDAIAAKRSSYNFTIPLMAVFSFNLSDAIRWNVEAGPYLSIVLSSKMKVKEQVTTDPDLPGIALPRKAAGADFGLKFGTGLTFDRHWSFSIHYLAGLTHAWRDVKLDNGIKQTYGGTTKTWTFTLGYDF